MLPASQAAWTSGHRRQPRRHRPLPLPLLPWPRRLAGGCAAARLRHRLLPCQREHTARTAGCVAMLHCLHVLGALLIGTVADHLGAAFQRRWEDQTAACQGRGPPLPFRGVQRCCPAASAWQPTLRPGLLRSRCSQCTSAPATCAGCGWEPAPARRAARRRCGSRTGSSGRFGSPHPVGSRPQTRL